jgi:hypothetical protein
MKKHTRMSVGLTLNKKCEQLTIGLDLGDEWSYYCVLDASGDVLLEQKVSTTPKAMREVFGAMLHGYLRNHGCPVAFYPDKHTVFRVNKPVAKGGSGMTQFGRALGQKPPLSSADANAGTSTH